MVCARDSGPTEVGAGLKARPYLVNHRCHLYQGTDTSTISAGHAMHTARRPSFIESPYSSSIATLMIISPVSVVIGPGGTESFDARAVFGQQKHPLSRVGYEGWPTLAERHLLYPSRAVRAPRG